MNEVTVKTSELLEILKENRKKHSQLYKDAVEGYQVETKKKLEATIKKVEKGDLVGSVKLNVPHDHTKDYDRVIRMLEMSVDSELELRVHEFDNYVLDQWISDEEKSILRGMALSSSNSAFYLGQDN